jgi:predicted acylesterase/phospholipase RssA
VFDMRECTTPAELADLVLASSATPPFTPVGRYGGRRLLDGGMVDNVPAFVTDALPGVTRNLVLLTRPYPASLLGPKGTRFYVAPLRDVPVDRWDYTRPQALEDTVTMGEQDAPRHWQAVKRFLDGD